jgi:hypothetical protein
VHPLAQHHSISDRDAADRLRYVGGVRRQVRKAALAPPLALLVLGSLLIAHGSLATIWPHAAALSIVWVGAVVAFRPIVRWLHVRAAQRRGMEGSARLRLACVAAAALALGVALAVGADPLISSITAAAALAAYLGGMPALAVAALAAGALGDLVRADGATPNVGQLIVGAGLLSAGAVALAQERRNK